MSNTANRAATTASTTAAARPAPCQGFSRRGGAGLRGVMPSRPTPLPCSSSGGAAASSTPNTGTVRRASGSTSMDSLAAYAHCSM